MTEITDSVEASLPVGPVKSHFYRLLWQPAAVMHTSWWSALELEAFRLVYQTTPRARPSINRCVVQRLASVSSAVASPREATVDDLNTVEQKMVYFAEKLAVLVPALGLLRLGRAEYWMLRDYRDALPELGAVDRAQLNVLAAPLKNASVPDDFHVNLPLLDPAHLAEQAMYQGVAVLTRALQDRPLLGLLEVLFKPAVFEKSPALDEAAATFGLNTLFRLARFL